MTESKQSEDQTEVQAFSESPNLAEKKKGASTSKAMGLINQSTP